MLHRRRRGRNPPVPALDHTKKALALLENLSLAQASTAGELTPSFPYNKLVQMIVVGMILMVFDIRLTSDQQGTRMTLCILILHPQYIYAHTTDNLLAP